MQPSIGVLIKRCSENMHEIDRKTLMLKCGCSPVSLLHIFRTPFPRHTRGLLLSVLFKEILPVRTILEIVFFIYSFSWASSCLRNRPARNLLLRLLTSTVSVLYKYFSFLFFVRCFVLIIFALN